MSKHRTIFAAFFLVSASSVLAEPTFVAHDPAGGVFGKAIRDVAKPACHAHFASIPHWRTKRAPLQLTVH